MMLVVVGGGVVVGGMGVLCLLACGRVFVLFSLSGFQFIVVTLLVPVCFLFLPKLFVVVSRFFLGVPLVFPGCFPGCFVMFPGCSLVVFWVFPWLLFGCSWLFLVVRWLLFVSSLVPCCFWLLPVWFLPVLCLLRCVS